MTTPRGNMRVRHSDDLVTRCHRCRAQAAAEREWGFSGFDFAALDDYEAILEQIAAELVVAEGPYG